MDIRVGMRDVEAEIFFLYEQREEKGGISGEKSRRI